MVVFMHQGHPNPLDGKQRAVKATLTKAYKEGRKTRMVRAADLVKLPGVKKAPKKRIAAILEPSDDGFVDGGGSTLAEGEEDNSSDMDELGKLQYLMQVFKQDNKDHPVPNFLILTGYLYIHDLNSLVRIGKPNLT